MPLPFIAPANNGMLVLEWETPEGTELIVDVPPQDEPVSFLLIEHDESGSRVETEEVIGERWNLREVIRRLLAR
jgi:hypothetical protein